jgi:transcriptional regulator with XRE-family HTH domain
MKNPISLLIERNQMTKQEFLRRTGMSWQGLLNLEHGKPIRLQQRTLKKLYAAFNIEPAEFQKEYLKWQLSRM